MNEDEEAKKTEPERRAREGKTEPAQQQNARTHGDGRENLNYDCAKTRWSGLGSLYDDLLIDFLSLRPRSSTPEP